MLTIPKQPVRQGIQYDVMMEEHEPDYTCPALLHTAHDNAVSPHSGSVCMGIFGLSPLSTQQIRFFSAKSQNCFTLSATFIEGNGFPWNPSNR